MSMLYRCSAMRTIAGTFAVFTVLLYGYAQDIGEPCLLRNGGIGTCENVNKCPSALQELRKKISPPLCKFDVNTPIVCCMRKGVASSFRKSEQQCHKYLTIVPTQPPPLIVGGGGVNAKPREFPHMALLGYNNTNNSKTEFKCGGSLISEQFVLTAAHCLEARNLGKVTVVQLGELDTATEDDDAEPEQFNVIERHSHPDYDFTSYYHDIALIKLDRPATFNAYVRPACLQSVTKLDKDNLTATGWGALYFGGDMHNFLQKLDIMNLPIKQCLPTYKKQPNLANGIDEELQICGGNLIKSVDTCQGDSGGPLQFQIQKNPPIYRVVGVTSFGINCNLVPGVYTRVSKYISWIESIVWP